jgi:hypothetical protein
MKRKKASEAWDAINTISWDILNNIIAPAAKIGSIGIADLFIADLNTYQVTDKDSVISAIADKFRISRERITDVKDSTIGIIALKVCAEVAREYELS